MLGLPIHHIAFYHTCKEALLQKMRRTAASLPRYEKTSTHPIKGSTKKSIRALHIFSPQRDIHSRDGLSFLGYPTCRPNRDHRLPNLASIPVNISDTSDAPRPSGWIST